MKKKEKYEDEFIDFLVGFYSEHRFILPPKSKRVLNYINKITKEYFTSTLNKSTPLFRARINRSFHKTTKPISIEAMGAPPNENAQPGRINPEGISYLYCASDEITAISEVRPWVNAWVTVANVKLNHELKLADFTKPRKLGNLSKLGTPKRSVFEDMLNWAFKTPRGPDDNIRYIPTQYIAENFKSLGYDGIKYTSGLSSTGFNLAIFNLNKAAVISTYSRQVIGVEYTTSV